MSPVSSKGGKPAADHEILKQSWFKSAGPHTYAAQVKKAGNGNHFLVLTEGKRDEKTDEVRKTRLFLFSEDFVPFFKMMQEMAVFIRENPVPEKIRQRQDRKWAKINSGGPSSKQKPQAGAANNGPRPGPQNSTAPTASDRPTFRPRQSAPPAAVGAR